MGNYIAAAGVLGALLLVAGAITALLYQRRSQQDSAIAGTESGGKTPSQDVMRLTLEAIQAGTWDYRPREEKLYLGEWTQWRNILGTSLEKKSFSIDEMERFIHPDDWPVFIETFREYIAGGGEGALEVEFRLRRKDGAWYRVLSKARAVEWDESGAPTRIVGLDVNIESLMDAREKLHHSEEKFRAIFENAPYPISIRSVEDGTYLEANKAFMKGLGIDPETLRQSRPEDLFTMDSTEAAGILDDILEQGSVTNREADMVKKDGSRIHIVFSSVLLEIEGRKRILSMAMNETERMRAQTALKESEARFRNLFKMAPLPMAHISLDGKVLDINDRLTLTMGYSLDTIPTLVHAWETTMPDPEFRNRITSQWKKDLEQALADNSEMAPFECSLHYRDGTVHTVVLTTRLLSDSIIVGFYDITQRKKAEAARERLQNQLLQSQKMEAVGILAGGIAHDFNNMLGAITGYTELVLSRMAPSDEHHDSLSKVLDAAKRSAGLTRQLLAFARKEAVSPTAFDLNTAVDALLKMIRRLIGENIELDWRPVSVPCTVRMDPSQLDQILLNLCVNAKDAISGVGRIAIETDTVLLEETYLGGQDRIDPGSYALLMVGDDGCGMDRETLDHIFEPFFTTKEMGRGTGMGLASVYGIVKQNGGAINVYSELDRGTTFRIHLPLTDAPPGTETAVVDAAPPESVDETVLLVEDDPMLLEMSSAMLQRMGYTVLSAGTPEEAIQLARETDGEIHLFVTDVVMPQMNGKELAERLASIRPGIKHLFMSGYTADIIAPQGILENDANFIQKPFSRNDLAAKIRQVLNG